MIQISIERIKRYALILGVTGTVVTVLTRTLAEGAGFLIGALLAILSIESWSRVAAALNPEAKTKPSATGSGIFLALRYIIIAACIYAMIKVLGVTPIAMLLGLLVSFAAVLIELGQQAFKK